MMKKICVALSLVLSLSLFGCGNDSTEKKDNQQGTTTENSDKVTDTTDKEKDITESGDTNKDVTDNLKDGTYEATADPWDYGQESATVTIKDGKITDIVLKRLTKDGKEVNYDEWTGAEVEGKVRPNLKQFREDMAKEMIEAQSYDVDTIATATVSTGNWKVAVQRALEKAK
ncbi:FMN-binding protein [Clostridium sp. N3C]|uniref:FMN-binding protein n=1 Tax=Clostridium sp. N3C TaxID=1776758 RepID=UPI001A9A2F5B|nr:FMN-binding protein [Clostridium sp. N3C]